MMMVHQPPPGFGRGLGRQSEHPAPPAAIGTSGKTAASNAARVRSAASGRPVLARAIRADRIWLSWMNTATR
jgi:hypothetical protein